jgi:hypothetical protein
MEIAVSLDKESYLPATWRYFLSRFARPERPRWRITTLVGA